MMLSLYIIAGRWFTRGKYISTTTLLIRMLRGISTLGGSRIITYRSEEKSVALCLSLTTGLEPDGTFWWVSWDGNPVRVCHHLCLSISIGPFLCIGKQHNWGILGLTGKRNKFPPTCRSDWMLTSTQPRSKDHWHRKWKVLDPGWEYCKPSPILQWHPT